MIYPAREISVKCLADMLISGIKPTDHGTNLPPHTPLWNRLILLHLDLQAPNPVKYRYSFPSDKIQTSRRIFNEKQLLESGFIGNNPPIHRILLWGYIPVQ